MLPIFQDISNGISNTFGISPHLIHEWLIWSPVLVVVIAVTGLIVREAVSYRHRKRSSHKHLQSKNGQRPQREQLKNSSRSSELSSIGNPSSPKATSRRRKPHGRQRGRR